MRPCLSTHLGAPFCSSTFVHGGAAHSPTSSHSHRTTCSVGGRLHVSPLCWHLHRSPAATAKRLCLSPPPPTAWSDSAIEKEFQWAFRVERNRDFRLHREARVTSRTQRQWSADLRTAYARHTAEVAARSRRMLWLLLRIADCHACLRMTGKAHVYYHSYHTSCVNRHDAEGGLAPLVFVSCPHTQPSTAFLLVPTASLCALPPPLACHHQGRRWPWSVLAWCTGC